jgi:hypothetical protein
MDVMTTKDAAELWSISIRRVQALCDSGKIPSATKIGDVWLMPKGTQKPPDGRCKTAKTESSKKKQIKSIP